MSCQASREYRSEHEGQTTARRVLTVVHHLLTDPDAKFCDLGTTYYDSHINKHRRARDLATQFQALTGQTIVIRDGKALIGSIPAHRSQPVSAMARQQN
jgi:hypothetical protein